jgi:hypothetical protein
MDLLTNAFDLWVFARTRREPTYLLLRTSQEKADRWFGGGRFWQIPGDLLEQGEDVLSVLERPLDSLGLEATAIWQVDYVYPFPSPSRGA